ncbi:glucosamine 6-phosphate N-acetyltransferase isoform X2 [Macrosteles quadrilineatus]|uniref:glucosamine 6-phosphate N-acetyltransferase isoform X2 n=1 Tax=Macrosteles quadrilineatus TaxID=74068 RepID=UPI0023E33B9D|nr:glucosamine 6-phosphate N-acetyltransferase isoform X2 [Macrosteles quadrilineatus]
MNQVWFVFRDCPSSFTLVLDLAINLKLAAMLALEHEDQTIYDKKVLHKLDFAKFESIFNPPISVSKPGEGLVIRPLQSSDFNLGYINLLAQLTCTGDISRKEFTDRFQSMVRCPNTYYITVVEDVTTCQIVGSASLVLEQKFIHKCALRGRVEDVVVSDQYRGKQLGKLAYSHWATMVATLVVTGDTGGQSKCAWTTSSATSAAAATKLTVGRRRG